MELYPLKFNPVFRYRIWAGEKLKNELNKNYIENAIGESWEISDVNENETFVAEGDFKGKNLKQLIRMFKGAFVGQHVYKKFGEEFPLLIKFIDAKEPLSIQVHPNDALAKKHHNSFGKNEMWYVMQADENAELIIGFNKKIEKKVFVNHLNKSTLVNILNVEKVAKGDVFYIPAGRIHAIGAGILLAEIQQKSDITYRIYDYSRIDSKTSKKRELHTELALNAIDFELYDNSKIAYNKQTNISNELVHSPYFKTNFMNVSREVKMDYSNLDSFVIYICTEGFLELEYKSNIYTLNKGETIVLPAAINLIKLKSDNADLLEISL